MKKLGTLVVIIATLVVAWSQQSPGRPSSAEATDATPARQSTNTIAAAFAAQRSDVQVTGTGAVLRLLADDNNGSRHQRFILQLADGQTVLVAHNIDLAPRLATIARGDTVRFNGEYEWNESGGVIHWTHRDPAGRHLAGWLEHDGRRVQ